MTLRRYIKYSVKTLFRNRSIYLILPILYVGILYFYLTYTVSSEMFTRHGPLHLGDVLFCIVGGHVDFAAAYDPKDIPFNIVYTLSFFILLFFPLRYFYVQLYGAGTQLLLRLGKRSYWWTGNLFIALLMTIIYCMLLLAGSVLLTLIKGWEMNLNLNEFFLESVLKLYMVNGIRPLKYIPILYLCSYPMVILTVFVWQGLLEFLSKPVYAYLAAFACIYTTNYLFNPVFFINGSMLLRMDFFYEHGTALPLVWLSTCLWLVLGIGAGYYLFRRMDILEKDDKQ